MIRCIYCDFEACRTCCEKYILSSSFPKCMKPECNKEWSRKFLRQNFTNIFLTTTYKSHIENLLFDQEKALLPATQILVEQRIAKKKILKEIQDVDRQIQELFVKRRNLERSSSAAVEQEDASKKFVRQCPATHCRGFLSTQWKCGICEQWTCPECHELKGDTRDCHHVCDPNNIETANLLNKDSKPCPKCQSLIFKINGCDQMWCTQCHTGFCWKTGRLSKHTIHNPHFYEWQRQNNTAQPPPHAIDCGQELTQGLVSHIYTLAACNKELIVSSTPSVVATPMAGQLRRRNAVGIDRVYVKEIDLIIMMIRQTIHNREVELPLFQTDYVTKNQQLRIMYLENTLSAQRFKTVIQRNDKKHKKNMEIYQTINLQITAFTDILWRLLQSMKNDIFSFYVHYATFRREIQELIKYCNEIFIDICFTYNINNNYAFINSINPCLLIRCDKKELNNYAINFKINTEKINTEDHATEL